MSEQELELVKSKEAKLQMINALANQGEDVTVLYQEVAKIDKELAALRKPPEGKVDFFGSAVSYPILGLALYGGYHGGMQLAKYFGLIK